MEGLDFMHAKSGLESNVRHVTAVCPLFLHYCTKAYTIYVSNCLVRSAKDGFFSRSLCFRVRDISGPRHIYGRAMGELLV